MIGDVKGGPQFTHISYDDYRILKANLFDGGNRQPRRPHGSLHRFHGSATGPGRYDGNRGEESGRKIRVARMPMASVARAMESGRNPRPDEGYCRCRNGRNSGVPRAGRRGRRGHGGISDGDDGPFEIRRAARSLSSPTQPWPNRSTTFSCYFDDGKVTLRFNNDPAGHAKGPWSRL